MDNGHPIPRTEVLAWLRAHKMSQSDLARLLGREASLVSKVLRGVIASGPLWTEIHKAMANPDDYRPPSIRSRRLANDLRRARRLVRLHG